MKITVLIFLLFLFTGMTIHASTNDFIQGSVRIVPPVKVSRGMGLDDGGTMVFSLKDARGKTFDIYVDHRLDTKTPGAIYLFAYPTDRGSVRVKNEAEFRRKLKFK